MKIKNQQDEIMKAGGVILNNEGEVLLVTTSGRDIWAYPKGHMEEGEDKETSAKREMFEETGYEVRLIKQLSDIVYSNQQSKESIRIYMFLADPVSKINEGEEGIIKQWFSIIEAKERLPSNLSFLLQEI